MSHNSCRHVFIAAATRDESPQTSTGAKMYVYEDD